MTLVSSSHTSLYNRRLHGPNRFFLKRTVQGASLFSWLDQVLSLGGKKKKNTLISRAQWKSFHFISRLQIAWLLETVSVLFLMRHKQSLSLTSSLILTLFLPWSGSWSCLIVLVEAICLSLRQLPAWERRLRNSSEILGFFVEDSFTVSAMVLLMEQFSVRGGWSGGNKRASPWPPRGAGGVGAGREAQERGRLWTLAVDPRCCMAETNTTS